MVIVIGHLRRHTGSMVPRGDPGGAPRRLIRRSKEFVHAHACDHILLVDVARAVGASPTYLTHMFRRFEGLPLHQYIVQTRLARAVAELPRANNLTTLAFDLGFSSHSHFTAAFRRAYGCTPSEFRESIRVSSQQRIA
jgi:AraC family transcriptional regulator